MCKTFLDKINSNCRIYKKNKAYEKNVFVYGCHGSHTMRDRL